ncbi:MAG: hypothetical protein Q9191_001576 [Dirinaria sp. TL-2023a]
MKHHEEHTDDAAQLAAHGHKQELNRNFSPLYPSPGSPNYDPKRWHQFLIYIGYNIVAFCINAFANHLLPWVTRGAFTWSIAGFVIISITVLACASPNFSSGDFVYRDFINQTGWPDGIAWLLGLLQAGLGLTGFDAVAHMIEEIPNPSVEGPKIMIACVGIGVFTGFIFLTVLLFVAGNPDDVIEAAAGPLLQIFVNATGSNAGSICLLMYALNQHINHFDPAS